MGGGHYSAGGAFEDAKAAILQDPIELCHELLLDVVGHIWEGLELHILLFNFPLLLAIRPTRAMIKRIIIQSGLHRVDVQGGGRPGWFF